jgi:signal transduction histidine kinase
VRRIIDRLGGDARIEAEPGEGATVHLLLPAADVPRARRSPRARVKAERS